jgi:hypothetical protein
MKLPTLGVALMLMVGPALAVAGELEDAVQSLKDAAAKNDVNAVKKLAATIRPMTAKIVSEPAPKTADEKKAWEQRVAHAKDAQSTVESVFYTLSADAAPEVVVDLISTLEQQNPKSKYLNDAYGPYLAALGKSPAADKGPAIAEKALANFPENDDLLMYLTEKALAKKLNDRALGYANRLTAAANKHAKPEGMSAEDWEFKRNAELAYGYYIAGYLSAEKGQQTAADKNLRAALPLIQDNPAYLGPALLYLGIANFKLGETAQNKARMLEGVKFSEQAMAIPGPHQEPARKNAAAFREAASKMP